MLSHALRLTDVALENYVGPAWLALAEFKLGGIAL
jgi:hypothetical protein